MLGDKSNPIPRDAFCRECAPWLLQATDKYKKVVPTLVLFPNANDDDELVDASVDEASQVATVMTRKDGQSYVETLRSCRGKSIVFNWCTPHMESYTKRPEQCDDIYESYVPISDTQNTATLLRQALLSSNPLVPNVAIDYQLVCDCMNHYTTSLHRTGPWFLALPKQNNSFVSALKLTEERMNTLFKIVGRDGASDKDTVYYREETFVPTYAFAVGDWVLMDFESMHVYKKDKAGSMYVRTVNQQSFESTYARY